MDINKIQTTSPISRTTPTASSWKLQIRHARDRVVSVFACMSPERRPLQVRMRAEALIGQFARVKADAILRDTDLPARLHHAFEHGQSAAMMRRTCLPS